MRTFLTIFFCFAFYLPLKASPVVSPSGIEGVIKFQATVFLPRTFVPPQVSNHLQMMSALVFEQTKHLLGVFEQKQFANINNLPSNDKLGALGLGTLKTFKVIREEARLDGTGWDVTYSAIHKIIIRSDVMVPHSTRRAKLFLPHDPIHFYARACTDKHYFQKQYLFYYWNPFDEDCSQTLTGKNLVDTIEAEIQTGAAPSRQASPDYDSLRKQAQTRGELRMALLFGFDLKSTDPNDEGRRSYQIFQTYFKKEGFVIDRQTSRSTGPNTDYVKEGENGRPTIRISLSVSASDINSPITFSRRARQAFENDDIIMYVGHSGLGGNLDLDQITKLSSPDPSHPIPIQFPNAYQIYFINSCASYFFYSNEYALVRRGVHHVDIITNGLASYFYTQNVETKNFLNSFIQPKKAMSWVEILSATEKASTNRHFSYLVNVSRIQ